MIYVYSISSQTVATEGPVQFSAVGVQRGREVTQSTETTITINCPGTYEIAFNGTAAAASTLQLYLNGEALSGALAEGTSLAFTALAAVNPNCCAITTNLPARIQVINTGAAEATLSNAALTIVKVW